MAGKRSIGWLRAPRMTETELAKRGAHLAEQLGRDDPLWPGQLAALAAIALYFLLPSKLKLGPGWPLPTAELVAFLSLTYVTRRRGRAMTRRLTAIVIVLVAILANLVALGLLVHYLLKGGKASGANLIDGGIVIWSTNLLLFTVLYWLLDRGGPLGPIVEDDRAWPDFLYPEMNENGKYAPHNWKPNFVDYLYVSLTNQSAFSPTDTLPLTLRAKVFMGVQGTASLVTVGIIVARAVNILGAA
ncbi:MAG: hypothetical protein ACJ77M_12860 [Thermoleophilaceae bacterium]